MYSSGYSQVNKLSPQGQKKMQYRSKGKSCGYYMRIVFFFSSLIQSLIIISLVLFLVYGKNEDSASTTNIQDLEETFSRLSIENVALRHQRKNLTNILNATLTEKARNDWDLAHLRHLSNVSFFIIHDYDRRLQQCNTEALGLKLRCSTPFRPQAPLQPFSSDCSGVAVNQLKAAYALLESNFTQTVQSMKMETEQIVKERDSLNLEAIHLRRDKSILEKEIQNYRQMTKDRFHDSMKSVSNVSRAFLKKIDSLLPRHLAFQLTCPKQRDHLEQIRSNCTSLSREVEEKLQYYMNNVGEEVSIIQAENNHLKAENWRLSEDYRWCSQNRTGMIEQHRQNREELQRNHDQAKEKLLIDKLKLIGEKKVLESSVKYKNTEVDHLREQIRQLNMTCLPKTTSASFGYRPNTQTGWGSLGGAGSSSSSSSSSTLSNQGRTGSDSSFRTGSGFNKPVSTGAGSSSSLFPSSGSSSSLSNTGLGINKPGSTGAGSSTSLFSSSGSSTSQGSTGLGFNKPVSTGAGSSSSLFPSTGSRSSLSNSGLGSNKPGSTGGAFSSFGSTGSSSSLSSSGTDINKPAMNGRGSTAFGSSSGSTGTNPSLSSSGIGLNKPTSIGKPSSGFGLGSSSTSTGTSTSSGSSSKTGSAFSWFGMGSSNSEQSKTGSVPGRTSSGSSFGGTGSSFGGGRTAQGGAQSLVSQHLQDLQRLINPSDPQEKQDLSRMLG